MGEHITHHEDTLQRRCGGVPYGGIICCKYIWKLELIQLATVDELNSVKKVVARNSYHTNLLAVLLKIVLTRHIRMVNAYSKSENSGETKI